MDCRAALAMTYGGECNLPTERNDGEWDLPTVRHCERSAAIQNSSQQKFSTLEKTNPQNYLTPQQKTSKKI